MYINLSFILIALFTVQGTIATPTPHAFKDAGSDKSVQNNVGGTHHALQKRMLSIIGYALSPIIVSLFVLFNHIRILNTQDELEEAREEIDLLQNTLDGLQLRLDGVSTTNLESSGYSESELETLQSGLDRARIELDSKMESI